MSTVSMICSGGTKMLIVWKSFDTTSHSNETPSRP